MRLRVALLLCSVVIFELSAVAEEFAAPEGMTLIYQHDFQDGQAERYQPTDVSAWKLQAEGDNQFLALTKKNSNFSPPFRSPLNRTLIKDLEVSSFVMDIRFQSTIADYPHRSLCLFFGYQDDAHLYYVHFGKRTDDHANQVFIVNGAPRVKISTKTTAGTPWTDEWHRARIVRDVGSGEITVYFDDLKTPIMTAVDRTFVKGRLGFGSFDDIGNFDDVKIYVPEQAAGGRAGGDGSR